MGAILTARINQPVVYQSGEEMRRWVSSGSYQAAIRAVVEARQEAGLTQRDLAAKLEKPPSFIAKIEVGERRLDFVEFIAIARALGCQPGSLMDAIHSSIPGEIDI